MPHLLSSGKAPVHTLKTASASVFIVILLCAGAWAVARAGGFGSAPASAVAAPQAKKERLAVESKRVTLTRFGFNPSSITRTRGRFLLAIDDQSGLAEADISLLREHGDKLLGAKVGRRNPRWNSVVDLPPGKYTLAVAGHDDWTCELAITPN